MTVKRFNPNKEEFIKKYDELKSSRKMAEFYGFDKATILNYAKEIGYVNNYRRVLNEEEIKYVLDNYYSKSSVTLSKELNVSKSYITKLWRINGLKDKQTRKYYLDEDYFETIDTKDKAYILGVIASDGCVYKRDKHIGMLSFRFHIQELDIINVIKKYMKLEYKEIITENRVALQINSDKIVSDLSKYNIIPRKTWSYKPYDLQDDILMWHFIRGYFDGDGSVYFSGKQVPSSYYISFCGNKETMIFINNFLQKHGIKTKLNKDNRPNKYSEEFYGIRIKENKSKEIFINYLYDDCNDIKLNRKYDKCVEFLNLYNKRLSS